MPSPQTDRQQSRPKSREVAGADDRLTYLQYGCGLSAPVGWLNFDASPTLRLQRLPVLGRLLRQGAVVFPVSVEYGDVVKGLPLTDGSCEAAYCSHVLEHLALNDLRRALRETHRVLARGAVFRLVVPDLEYSARAYLANEAPDAAFEFMRTTRLGKEERRRSLRSFLHEWLGNSEHLWMWDYRSLASELARAGFTDIRRAEFGDSSDPKFHEVEHQDRWTMCLGIECRKE
jgi:hypothetical protein